MRVQYCVRSHCTDDELHFIKHLGIDYVYVMFDDNHTDYDSVMFFMDRLKKAGLTATDGGNTNIYKNPSIHLGFDDRDGKIEDYIRFTRILAKAGIKIGYATWEPNQVLTTKWDVGEHTHGAVARIVDIEELKTHPNSHGRVFEKEEIWANFKYFLDAVLPVCEELDFKLALHPNDPPVPMLKGIYNLIHSSDDYRHAFDLAGDSDRLGIKLCTGCWLEGGTEHFGDLLYDIEEFVRRGKVLIVHFRNVSDTIPYFEETLLEDGYMDMYTVMKKLVDCGYNGMIHVDHVPRYPESCGGDHASFAYSYGYMKALLHRAEAEAKARK
ncbi:MAG: D-mannonate dehydratase [Provencibacterium sp.]|jgi:mannonate dehydratase|nr:D-mannonate dehydratase [Provencibacterium sp.]